MLNSAPAEIRVLSHACLLVKCGNASVIVDPWLLGSCYWRSWWNFPEASYDEAEVRAVDAVVLSHIHWDHWHGPTIKKLLRDKPFIISDEPNTRSADDLRRIGVRDITRVKHGGRVALGPKLSVTLYQFGLWMSDTAIVIEAGETKILNANDAKIAGLPLRQILRRHGAFHFALRSHSSANARACLRIEGQTALRDDALHYARSFQLFMNAVRPLHAIPFASNHCYLHPDTERFNDVAVSPLRLREQINQLGGLAASELVVMAPGSRWRAGEGFSLASTRAFEDPAAYLADYRERMGGRLQATLDEEQRVEIKSAVWSRLVSHLRRVPRWRRRKANAPRSGIELYWPDGRRQYFELDVVTPAVREVSAEVAFGWPARMRWPAAVFRDVVMKCMYSHGMISKRFEFVAREESGLVALVRAWGLLDQVESGVFPMRARYVWRTALSYLRRWREVVVYLQAAFLMYGRRLPGYQVEEVLLQRTRRDFTAPKQLRQVAASSSANR